MSGFRSWGGNRTGEIIVATERFSHRVGSCYLEKDDVELPSGITLKYARGMAVAEFLPTGTVAVATEHSGDFYNTYVPVVISDRDGDQMMTPFTDLTFGAYGFGESVGRLESPELAKIAAGVAIMFSHPLNISAV